MFMCYKLSRKHTLFQYCISSTALHGILFLYCYTFAPFSNKIRTQRMSFHFFLPVGHLPFNVIPAISILFLAQLSEAIKQKSHCKISGILSFFGTRIYFRMTTCSGCKYHIGFGLGYCTFYSLLDL